MTEKIGRSPDDEQTEPQAADGARASGALEPGQAQKPWSFGSTLGPGMHVDITGEIHASKRKLFDDAPLPLLGKFVYRRAVTESTEKPPAAAGAHQCFEATFPETDYSN